MFTYSPTSITVPDVKGLHCTSLPANTPELSPTQWSTRKRHYGNEGTRLLILRPSHSRKYMPGIALFEFFHSEFDRLLFSQLSLFRNLLIYAGINLTGYTPRAPRGFCTEMCAQPRGFCTAENARGLGICTNWLSNMKIVNTVMWA